MNFTIMTFDFKSICRICLNQHPSEGHLFNILDYKDVFYLLTKINISSNDTGKICKTCLNQLNKYESFRELCITSHNFVKDCQSNGKESQDIDCKIESPEDGCETVEWDQHSDVDTTSTEYTNTTDTKNDSIYNSNKKSRRGRLIKPKVVIESRIANVEKISNKTKSTHRCTYSKCSKVFLNSKSLVSHMKSHTVQTGQKPYLCSFCGRGFTTSGTLVIHMRSHTGEKPLLCSHCPKDFSARSGLVLHLRSHTGEKPYLCSVCGDRFRSSSELSAHTRGHTGQKPFVCSNCKKSFRTSYSRTIHMRIHTGERPAKCTVCSKSFISNGHLYTHMKSHKKDKKHICEECPKAFKTLKDLNIHKILHSGYAPFVCDICTKGFNRANNLAKHLRLHAGIKPYSCETCPFTFPTSSQLKIHVRSHTGERPYVCHCGKAFASSSGIARHRRKQHETDRGKTNEKTERLQNQNVENTTKDILWVYEMQDGEDLDSQILENVEIINQSVIDLNKSSGELDIINNLVHLAGNPI